MPVCCDRCGKLLTDPVSIKRGLGPICNERENALGAAEPRQRSLFDMKPKSWNPEEIKIPDTGAGKKYVLLAGYGDSFVNVVDDDNGPRALTHILFHSPTGMSFGYGGSGPADCARSILADCAGIPVADTYYQEFKFDFISGIDKEGGEILEKDIINWLHKKQEKNGQ